MARKTIFIRDELLIFVGLIPTLFGVLALIGFAADPRVLDDDVVGPVLFAATILAGGVAMIVAGLRCRRLERLLRRLLEYLEAVDRVSLASLAERFGIPESEVEQRVAYLIARGLTPVRLDLEQGMVYRPDETAGDEGVAGGWLVPPPTCPACGAPTSARIPVDEAPVCTYCGAALPVEQVSPPEPARAAEAPGGALGGARPAAEVLAMVKPEINWAVAVFLFFIFWPAGVIYLMSRTRRAFRQRSKGSRR
jgi:hypothetical protein